MNPTRRSFHWQATAEEVRGVLERGAATRDAAGRLLVPHSGGGTTVLTLPPVLRIPTDVAPLGCASRVPDALGVEVVLLL